jgi:hypothetical protein
MVTRGLLLVAALLMAGCPDSLGSRAGGSGGLLPPDSLAGTANGGSEIVLTWADRATTETGYRLEVNHAPFGTPFIADLKLLGADASSHVYDSFPNTTYYFRVVAVTAAMESDPSNVLVLTTPNVPERPSGVRACPDSSSTILVTWQDVFGESGYVVERSSDGGATWTGVGAAPADATRFVSSGMPPDREFAHRVVAVNANGRSTPSASATSMTMTASVELWGVSATGDFGLFTSIALAPDGLEHIAHYHGLNRDVLETRRVVTPTSHFLDVTTVDGGSAAGHDVGGDGTGIAIDAAGKVHIVAHDRTGDVLRYATNASGAWAATTLDGPGVGVLPQIVCDRTTGDLHVVYRETAPDPTAFVPNTYVVRYLRKSPGQPWTRPSRPLSTDPAVRFSLGVNPSNIPHVLVVNVLREPRVYYGLTTGGTAPGGGVPMIWAPYPSIPLPVATSQIDDVALSISDLGRIHVVFHEPSTRSIHHALQSGPTWTLEEIDRSPGLDLGTSCAVAAQPGSSRVHVAYTDATNRDLRYARRDPGGPWVRRVIDAQGDVGFNPAIAANASGVIFIAYRDETFKRIKVAIGSP